MSTKKNYIGKRAKVVNARYGTTVRRDALGRVIVDDAKEVEMTKLEEIARKEAKEAELKTPEGIYKHNAEVLHQKIVSFADSPEFLKLWGRYEAFALKMTHDVFHPNKEAVAEAKRKLTMADDTDGALRIVRNAFERSANDMVWMMVGHLDPTEKDYEH